MLVTGAKMLSWVQQQRPDCLPCFVAWPVVTAHPHCIVTKLVNLGFGSTSCSLSPFSTPCALAASAPVAVGAWEKPAAVLPVLLELKRPILSPADVKPSNVLINKEGHVKMCDFGISGYLVDSVAKTLDAGCKPYMAVSSPPLPYVWGHGCGSEGMCLRDNCQVVSSVHQGQGLPQTLPSLSQRCPLQPSLPRQPLLLLLLTVP